MKTRQEDLAIIHNAIFPAILGTRRFLDLPETVVHMGYNEASVFQALLSNLRPKCSVEIGTETGATLAIIARHSTRAISIDIDPNVKTRLIDKFANVEFVTGSSH